MSENIRTKVLSSFPVFSKSISHFLYIDLTLCQTVCCYRFLSSRCELCSSCNIICLTVTGTCWRGRPRHLTYLFWIFWLERDCLDKWGLNKPVICILSMVNDRQHTRAFEKLTLLWMRAAAKHLYGNVKLLDPNMFPHKSHQTHLTKTG